MWLDSQSQHPLARLHLPQGRGRFFFVGHLGGLFGWSCIFMVSSLFLL